MALDPVLDGRMKRRKVTVHGRQAASIEIEGQSIAAVGHLDAGDCTILGRQYRNALPALGADVHARMKMPGSDLSEISTELQWNGQGSMQGILSCSCLTHAHPYHQQHCRPATMPIHSLPHVRKLPRPCRPEDSNG